MDVGEPQTVISPTLDGAVLTLLAGTTRPLTGREVARLLGRRSHGGVLDALTRLTKQGIVDRQEAGRALLYTLNREHLAAPVVERLADLRSELLRRLSKAIEAWEIAPVHASLFGSTARGEGDADSDIDLFIVRPDDIDEDDPTWREQLDSLSSHAFRWTGNHVSIAEVGAKELKRLRRERPPIVKQLRSDAIVLAGPEVAVLLGAGRDRPHPAVHQGAGAQTARPRQTLLGSRRTLSAETEPEYASVAAALAVLAGIAACDAACCQSLGRRARGQHHHDAEELVSQIEPGGRSAASSLRRVLTLKDQAHYGLFDVGGRDVKAAPRQARSLVTFAEQVMQR